MENKTYTIKDIARMAGVSAGTVDRVLHNRGDVSEKSRIKVQRVLDEIDYRPNMFAIGLAAKKSYRFLCVVPHSQPHDYWNVVTQGIQRAADELRPLNVHVEYLYYHHAERASYEEVCRSIEEQETDGVVIAPNFTDETIRLADSLEQREIPYLFVDFNVEQTHALSYIGQDSRQSGYIAAKMLMQHYEEGDELVLFLNNQKENPAEIQMQRRLEGFTTYLATYHNRLMLHDVILDKNDATRNGEVLDRFFEQHPHAVLGAVFNSRIYQVGDYLAKSGKRLKELVGYDLLPENVRYLRQGEVGCLIGQRPELQGYYGLQSLCNHVVFKKEVPAMRYMPIDLLMKENIDYYFENIYNF